MARIPDCLPQEYLEYRSAARLPSHGRSAALIVSGSESSLDLVTGLLDFFSSRVNYLFKDHVDVFELYSPWTQTLISAGNPLETPPAGSNLN